MSQIEQLFYEDIYDAMRAAVQYLGGAKAVGPKLWPNKSDKQAWKDILDCLNRNNERKFDPEEVMAVFRFARDAGFHAGFHYVCDQIGYHKPGPVTAQEQAESIMERAAELARESRAVATQLERLHQSGVLRPIKGATG